MAVESVAGCSWNGWPNGHGISGRISVEFALAAATKVISDIENTYQTGRIRMSHLGKSGLRSNLASTSRIAFLDSEMPFR